MVGSKGGHNRRQLADSTGSGSRTLIYFSAQMQHTLIKKKNKFPHISGNSVGSGAKSYMTNGLLIEICAFPHILGSPSSYMTLHPIPSEFPYTTVYEENFVFFFISVLSFLLRPRNPRSRSENSSPRHNSNKHFRQPDLHKNVLPYSHRRHTVMTYNLLKLMVR